MLKGRFAQRAAGRCGSFLVAELDDVHPVGGTMGQWYFEKTVAGPLEAEIGALNLVGISVASLGFNWERGEAIFIDCKADFGNPKNFCFGDYKIRQVHVNRTDG